MLLFYLKSPFIMCVIWFLIPHKIEQLSVITNIILTEDDGCVEQVSVAHTRRPLRETSKRRCRISMFRRALKTLKWAKLFDSSSHRTSSSLGFAHNLKKPSTHQTIGQSKNYPKPRALRKLRIKPLPGDKRSRWRVIKRKKESEAC